MSDSSSMTISMEPHLQERLEQLAQATHSSKSLLATKAILEFVELNEWQLSETRAAIKEADAGDFASAQQVKDVMNKWQVNGS
jgi:RHH-type rel operon transcriptional repressor/antitoxin RelB